MKKKKPSKPRNFVVLNAILTRKASIFGDRRNRRPKDARRSFQKEEW